MTIQDRIDRFKSQAVWHAQRAAKIGADLRKMEKAAESGDTLPDIYSNLLGKRELSRAFADDLRWVLANIEKLATPECEQVGQEDNSAEKECDANTQEAGSESCINEQLDRPAVPSHFEDATRRRIYILRAMWDGQPKTAAWVTEAINSRYKESFLTEHIGKMMGNMHVRQSILEKVSNIGPGYYKISSSHRESNSCP